MKQKRLGMLGAGFALALSALTGVVQATQPLAQQQTQSGDQGEMKAVPQNRRTKEAININAMGGLNFKPLSVKDYGMSPKAYEMRFGNGKSKNGKNNFQRMSHNAKLKRR